MIDIIRWLGSVRDGTLIEQEKRTSMLSPRCNDACTLGV
jgi:hypothetical protein